MNIYWLPWCFGILIPFAFKVGHHLFEADRTQVKFQRALLEFVFADSEASTKTVLTFATEMLMGAVYIDRLEMPYMPAIELPLNWALCFFLALISELVAPFLVGAIVTFAQNKIKKVFQT